MTSTIIAALIAAVPATFAACAAWHTGNKNSKNIGKSNGEGSAMEMLEKLVRWTEHHEGRHEILEKLWLPK